MRRAGLKPAWRRLEHAACPCDPAGISEVRKDRRDATRRGPLERVDHQEQFHQIGIHRRATRLNNEDVGAPDILFDLKIDFAVAETGNRRLAHAAPQVLTDLVSQIGIRTAGKYFQRISHTQAS